MSEEKEDNMKLELLRAVQKQGFSVVLMAVMCWVMYSMVKRNDNEMRQEMKSIKADQKECNTYNREVMEGIVRENILLMKEVRDELRDRK